MLWGRGAAGAPGGLGHGARGWGAAGTAPRGCSRTAPASQPPRTGGCPSAPHTWGGLGGSWVLSEARSPPPTRRVPPLHDAAPGPDVRGHPMALAVQHLRGHVGGGPAQRPGGAQGEGEGGPTPCWDPPPAQSPAHPQHRVPTAAGRASPRSPIFTCILSVTSTLPAGMGGRELGVGGTAHPAAPPAQPQPHALGLRSRCTRPWPWR